MKFKFLSLALGLTLLSCQSNMPPVGLAPMPNGVPQLSAQRRGAPQSVGDIAVKFNNAYQPLYVQNEAAGRRDPQNPDKLFVQLIGQAQNTLDLAIFDIDEPSAVIALVNAKKRGVKVRVITDSDNMYKNGQLTSHMQVLKRNGISIKGDDRSGLMHHKFLIMDGIKVITGSANLTPYSLYRDNNNSMLIESPELAANFQIEFNRMFHRSMFGPNDHRIPYPVVKVDGGTINTYFSPKGGAKMAILQTLGKARANIKFMTFSVTDKDIQKLLVDKAKAGVKVEGIFDGCMISQYSIYQDLLTKNIPVMIDGNQALLHSKVFIVDNQVVITGSYNYSMSAEERNNENTLIIKSKKVTTFYNQEFERLKKASLNNKVPPYDNRQCSSNLDGDDINPH